jgi:LacI family transcriptional regulator
MAPKGGPDVAVTLRVVARKAGVSTATVSRVFQGSASTSDSTRARVIAAAQQLGYTPPARPRRPATSRHEAFGLVLADLAGSDCSELVLGHESAAAALGQRVILVVTQHREDASDAVSDLAQRVDGLVIGAGTVPDAVAHSLSHDLPVVLLARRDVPGCDSVRADNVESATALTSHLFGHGRSRLVFVGDPDSSPQAFERYTGFRNAHVAGDVPLRRPPIRVPLVEGAGVQVAEEILRRRVKIDGLVCGNDALALAMMKRLQDNGVRIPDDLSITGWDDVLAARYISPGLTTVRQPMQELGRLTAERLHARIIGEPPADRPEVLPTRVILRSSCGCSALPASTHA